VRGIYLPKRNVGFIMTHRSGSRLMLTTLKYFFDIIEMEYEYIGYYDLLEFTTKYKRRKFFILTRDPIERFVSGYTWLKKNLDKRYLDYFKKFNVNTISDYVTNYVEICDKLPDAHFLPQTHGILSLDPEEVDFEGFKELNFRKSFDELFYHYKIIHLEDFEKASKKDKLQSTLEHVENSDGLINLYSNEMLHIFDEFYDLTNHEKLAFNFSYDYSKRLLDENHHINKREELSPSDLLTLNDIFKKEYLFYGYDIKKPIIDVIKPPEKINLSFV
jgi:hypothetical protein